MKNKLFIKTTSRSNSEAIAQKLFALLITSALSSAGFITHAMAQTTNGKANATNKNTNTNLLANAIDGKLLLKADVGYVYNFAGGWTKSGTGATGDNQSVGAGGFGYGVSLGYTNKSGWGVSADYLGFNHKWTGAGAGGNGNYNFDAPYHVMTITPSYRFALDRANQWGLRLGLGLGFSISDISWKAAGAPSNGASNGTSNGTKVAGGAAYNIVQGAPVPNSGSGQVNANCLANGNFIAIDGNKTSFPATTPTNTCFDKTSGSTVPVAGSHLSDAEIASLFAIDGTADANSHVRGGARYNTGTVAKGVWSDNAILGDANVFKNMLANVGGSNRADDTFEANTSNVTIANNAWTGALNFGGNAVKGLFKLLSVVDASKTTFTNAATTTFNYGTYSALSDADRGLLVSKLGARTFGAVPDSAWAAGGGLNLGFNNVAGAPTLTYGALSEATLKDKAKDANSLKTLLDSMATLGAKATVGTVSAPVTIDYSVYNNAGLTAAQKTQLDALVKMGKVALGAAPAPTADSGSGGKAKDDAGVVIAPQASLEYDNGIWHADVNVKYIHELVNVRYFGDENAGSGSASGLKTSGAVTYTSKAGPLAIFVGVGLGLNF